MTPPPLPPSSLPPPPERVDIPEAGSDNELGKQYVFLGPSLASPLHHEAPSSAPSPPPPPPPPVVQRPVRPSSHRQAIAGAGGGSEAQYSPLFVGLPPGSAAHSATPAQSPSPTSPKPLPVFQRLSLLPSFPPPSPAAAAAAGANQAPLSRQSSASPDVVAWAPVPLSPELPLSTSPSSFNPFAGMFSPSLEQASMTSSMRDALHRGGILPVSAKSRQALKAAGRGEATASMMEAIIRGYRSAHGRVNLARDHGGAEFVGPTTRTPSYNTGKGLKRLLREASLCVFVLIEMKGVLLKLRTAPLNISRKCVFFSCLLFLFIDLVPWCSRVLLLLYVSAVGVCCASEFFCFVYSYSGLLNCESYTRYVWIRCIYTCILFHHYSSDIICYPHQSSFAMYFAPFDRHL